MKELLSVLAVFICTYSAAQVKIITAIDTSLYVGVDNPVKIESATIPLSKLKLRSGNGEVSGKEGKYIIKCSKAGQAALLDVVYNNKVVATKKINVNRINDPVVYALGERLFADSIITKRELATIKSFAVKLNYPLVKYTVTDCTVEIIKQGKSTGTLPNSGQDLSPEIKAFLKYAEAGDEIIFNSIRVLCPDSQKRYVPSIRLKVI